MTPNIAVVQVSNPYWRGCRLWLPLFLLWIPLVVLAPFVLLAMLIASLALGIPFWRSINVFWNLLCGLPGTEVRVQAQANSVLVRIL
jgi:hypothetical protein